MPVRFGYDEELPNNWTNTGDTYNGPGIASNMQSYGMNGSPYSALVPQGQANPFAGTLAMNPGATDTNNFSGWESQFTQPSQPQSPVIGSPALTGGGQRPASAGGTGGYDPNWQPLLTPYNTSNPGAAGDPDAWVRNLDQETYYKYILPYQQRGGNIRDVSAMQKVIQDGMSAAGGGQWANGSQVNNVAGQRNNYINDPNAYGNQNRGGGSSPQATSTGQPTQNGSVSNTPQFNWPNLPQVDPATNYGGGVMDAAAYGGSKPFNLNDFLINQYNGNNAPGGGMMGRDSRGYAGQLSQGQMRFLASGGSPSDMVGMSNAQYQQPARQYAPGSMEERYAAAVGGGNGSLSDTEDRQYRSSWGGDPNAAYRSANEENWLGGYPTGGMDQPWNQGSAAYGSGSGGADNMGSIGYSNTTMQDVQNWYNQGGQNPNFDLSQLFGAQNGGRGMGSQTGGMLYGAPAQSAGGGGQNSLAALYQQFMGGNGGQVSGSGYAAPGSMQQRQQSMYQNPGAMFGSPAAGGGTNTTSGSGGGSSATPVMASPSFGFGSATGRRTGYGNQNSYYGGSSNPNSFGGSNFGNFSTAGGGGNSATNRPYIYPNSSQSSNSTGGFAAGRTGRPAGFTF